MSSTNLDNLATVLGRHLSSLVRTTSVTEGATQGRTFAAMAQQLNTLAART